MYLSFKTFPAVLSQKLVRSGLTVVFAHGLLGCKRNWQAVAHDLSSAGCNGLVHNVVTFDWTNHGKSPSSPQHSLDRLTCDLENFLGQHFPPAMSHHRVVVVGHSMGSLPLMNMLHLRRKTGYGNVVAGVCVDMAPGPRPAFADRLASYIRHLPGMPLSDIRSPRDAQRWVELNCPKDFSSNTWLVRYLLSNLIPNPNRPGEMMWAGNIKAISEGTPSVRWPHKPQPPSAFIGQADSRISLPTQFIFGSQSPYFTPHAIESIHSFFSNARVDDVEGAGHFVHVEKRQSFIEVLSHFLEQLI